MEAFWEQEQAAAQQDADQDPNAAQPTALLFHDAPDLPGCCADGAELSIALYFVVHRDAENALDDDIPAGKHKGSYAENFRLRDCALQVFSQWRRCHFQKE